MRALLPVLILLVAIAVPTRTWAASEITRCVIGSGGGPSSSSTHSLQGTAGQITAGTASSASHGVGSGFWSGGIGVVVGITHPPDSPNPVAYRLYQNLPNPSSSRTTIRFDVPEHGAQVALRIYNLRGALVTTLIEGPQPAGERSVTWNGLDDRGESVAAGVYLYVLEAPETRFVRKLTKLR
jgi:flagellar hook assembly protein FlgD